MLARGDRSRRRLWPRVLTISGGVLFLVSTVVVILTLQPTGDLTPRGVVEPPSSGDALIIESVSHHMQQAAASGNGNREIALEVDAAFREMAKLHLVFPKLETAIERVQQDLLEGDFTEEDGLRADLRAAQDAANEAQEELAQSIQSAQSAQVSSEAVSTANAIGTVGAAVGMAGSICGIVTSVLAWLHRNTPPQRLRRGRVG